MDMVQATVDAAEDAAIHHYRKRRTQVGDGLTVSCSRCGIAQIVRPDHGVLRFTLVCLSCHKRTLFTLPAAL